jgi:hypothetical protein
MAPDVAANVLSSVVTAAATVVLAWFGKTQIDEARRDREARKSEIAFEREERLRSGLGVLRVEMGRVIRLSQRWAQLDLVALARGNQLRPEELPPPDWGLIATALGQAGSATVAISSVAFGKLDDAIFHAYNLASAAEHREKTMRSKMMTDDERTAYARDWDQKAKSLVGTLRQELQDAADGLSDAIEAVRLSDRQIEIPETLKSNVTNLVRAAIG